MSDSAGPRRPESASVLPARLGWREWAGLPGLDIRSIRAKLDTGARSSSLHVEWIRVDERQEGPVACFGVRIRRRALRVQECVAPIVDRRPVRDSGGHSSERWFVRTRLALAGRECEIDINLTDRGGMLFPLLLGRSALAGRFQVDPGLSYSLPRPRPSPLPA
jgi:hypothetical protein